MTITAGRYCRQAMNQYLDRIDRLKQPQNKTIPISIGICSQETHLSERCYENTFPFGCIFRFLKVVICRIRDRYMLAASEHILQTERSQLPVLFRRLFAAAGSSLFFGFANEEQPFF